MESRYKAIFSSSATNRWNLNFASIVCAASVRLALATIPGIAPSRGCFGQPIAASRSVEAIGGESQNAGDSSSREYVSNVRQSLSKSML